MTDTHHHQRFQERPVWMNTCTAWFPFRRKLGDAIDQHRGFSVLRWNPNLYDTAVAVSRLGLSAVHHS